MLDAMSIEQLAGWMAYAREEPFGEERADLRMGILASVTANINRNPDAGKPFTPLDFMPRFGAAIQTETPEQAVDRQIQIAAMMAEAGLGVITHGNDS